MEEKFIQVNNLKVFTRIEGQGSPFLILHGWGVGHSSWIETQDKLSKNFQVITLDLPGFGKSDLPEQAWNVQNYVDFVLDFMNILGIDKFYLLGHSFGGRISIKLAAQSPEKIKKLILVDSAGIRHNKPFIKKVVSKFKIFSRLPGYNVLRRLLYRILNNRDYFEEKGIKKEIHNKVIAEDLTDYLKKIFLPVLIIWGKRDKLTPIKDGYLMKKKIKNSELKIFDCGHGPHHEEPDLLIKTILDFIKDDE